MVFIFVNLSSTSNFNTKWFYLLLLRDINQLWILTKPIFLLKIIQFTNIVFLRMVELDITYLWTYKDTNKDTHECLPASLFTIRSSKVLRCWPAILFEMWGDSTSAWRETSHIDRLSYNFFHNNSNASFPQPSYAVPFPNDRSEQLTGYSVAQYKTTR